MSPQEKVTRGGRRWIGLAVVLAVSGAISIITTYGTLSGTYDESVHIAAGVELLTRGTYTYSLEHTPIARVAEAIGPVVAGARFPDDTGYVTRANAVMASGSGYVRNLTLARFGALPFFLLACALLFVWARQLAGDAAAAVAVGLLALTPPVLAHAGLATTDGAAMAAFCAVVLAFDRWLECPESRSRMVWLGVAGGFALGSKLSSIPFFGATALVMLAAHFTERRKTRRDQRPPGRFLRPLAGALLIALLVVFASYGFSISRTLDFPAPLGEFVFGIMLVAWHNSLGNATFLLGDVTVGGRWAFFPVALGVKTPIPLLLLAAAGMLFAVRSWRRGEGRPWLTAPIAALIPFAVACSSGINLGVRHILPMYPALALLGGLAVARLWRMHVAARTLVVALLVWMAVNSWRAHPDYLAYFNELAGRDPGAVLVESDLDWGQDLERLSDTLRVRGISEFSFAYFGFGDRADQLFPQMHRFERGDPPPTGWFAVSETLYRRGYSLLENRTVIAVPDAFAWLREREPVARVGRSIRLYHLPPPNATPASR
ncbi:MAG: glycosyltransferase family 39 protein [Gemmatimonas sp.]